ncbi:MAG: hypothetical protein R3190_06395 [Thermoanaerobaculia bacterium]|nr:hypothetical protein [Thermoanaerobaculia bacterium]
MSFREKSAWISLGAFAVVGAVYFLYVQRSLQPARGFLLCILAFVAIEVAGHVMIALRSPRDARAPKDERERLIELRALRLGAYVYVVGSFVAVHTLHHGADAIAVGNGVLLAFLVAELVNYGARITFHRRGF